jgi:hypothetical protein
VAAKELKIQAGFISNTWAQGETYGKFDTYLYIDIFISTLSLVIKHPGGSCCASLQSPEDLLSAHPCERPAG